MKNRLEKHLRAERKDAFKIMLFGASATAIGIVLAWTKISSFTQGFGAALSILSLLPLWSGIHLLGEVRRLKPYLPGLLASHPARFRSEEIDRCDRNERHFNRQRNFLILFLFMGIILALLGGVLQQSPFTMGTGFGLCLESAVLLVFDLAAQWRNTLYRQRLENVH